MPGLLLHICSFCQPDDLRAISDAMGLCGPSVDALWEVLADRVGAPLTPHATSRQRLFSHRLAVLLHSRQVWDAGMLEDVRGVVGSQDAAVLWLHLPLLGAVADVGGSPWFADVCALLQPCARQVVVTGNAIRAASTEAAAALVHAVSPVACVALRTLHLGDTLFLPGASAPFSVFEIQDTAVGEEHAAALDVAARGGYFLPVTDLTLGGTGLASLAAASKLVSLGHSPNLSRLSLSFDTMLLDAFASHWAPVGVIDTLSIRGCGTFGHVEAILRRSLVAPTLTQLTLGGIGAAPTALPAVLRTMSKLASLTLDQCDLDDALAADCVASLRGCPLRALALRRMPLSAPVVPTLSAALHSLSSSLERLSLHRLALSAECWSPELLAGLAACTRLSVLDLSGNALRPEVGRTLAVMLAPAGCGATSSCLEEGDALATAACTHTGSFPVLRVLRLGECRLGTRGVVAMLDAAAGRCRRRAPAPAAGPKRRRDAAALSPLHLIDVTRNRADPGDVSAAAQRLRPPVRCLLSQDADVHAGGWDPM